MRSILHGPRIQLAIKKRRDVCDCNSTTKAFYNQPATVSSHGVHTHPPAHTHTHTIPSLFPHPLTQPPTWALPAIASCALARGSRPLDIRWRPRSQPTLAAPHWAHALAEREAVTATAAASTRASASASICASAGGVAAWQVALGGVKAGSDDVVILGHELGCSLRVIVAGKLKQQVNREQESGRGAQRDDPHLEEKGMSRED